MINLVYSRRETKRDLEGTLVGRTAEVDEWWKSNNAPAPGAAEVNDGLHFLFCSFVCSRTPVFYFFYLARLSVSFRRRHLGAYGSC